MGTDIVTREAFYLAAAPLLVALLQGIKAMLPEALHKYIPAIAVLFGLLAAFGAVSAFPLPPQPWPVTVVIGLGIGFGAVGLFAGVRSLAGPAKTG